MILSKRDFSNSLSNSSLARMVDVVFSVFSILANFQEPSFLPAVTINRDPRDSSVPRKTMAFFEPHECYDLLGQLGLQSKGSLMGVYASLCVNKLLILQMSRTVPFEMRPSLI